VSNCLCQLLQCIPDEQWLVHRIVLSHSAYCPCRENVSKNIVRQLLAMETKNYRVLLANRIPTGDRGRKLQITMAGLLLCEILKVEEQVGFVVCYLDCSVLIFKSGVAVKDRHYRSSVIVLL